MKSNLSNYILLKKIIIKNLIELPTPRSLNLIWNYGSLVGLCLRIQLLTGLFLAIHYSADVRIAFQSVDHIYRDVNIGWIIRSLHANGARAFFIIIYTHIFRGLFYSSFRWKSTWSIGIFLLFLVIAAAFLGYVLPWGQISFWGATVITNLFSAIPYVGEDIVFWLWGSFSVRNSTLTRFFTLHFLIPFILVALSRIHLFFLHQSGSSNPLGLRLNSDKIFFHPYFSIKDLIGVRVFALLFLIFIFQTPWALGDPENFILANVLTTPPHIQPEWYFLFAYAILRSIPNKLGGVVALFGSVLIILTLIIFKSSNFQGVNYYKITKMIVVFLLSVVVLLTWIGAKPVEEPYVAIGQVLTLIYFVSYFLIVPRIFVQDSMFEYFKR